MTVPTNLFIDTPDAEDISMTQLSTDVTEWPDQIIAKLKERIPGAATASLSLKFMKKDDETGAATGSITVTNGSKSVVVPVVVKEFEMHPLDIMMSQGRILPLTQDSFSAIFSNGTESPFGVLEEYPALTTVDRYLRGETLQNAIFPPNWGRYSFASDQSSLVDQLQGTCDGESYIRKIASDKKHLAFIERSGNLPILEKIANLHPVNMGEFRQGIDKLVKRTRHVLKKDGPNRYTLLSSAKNTFNPAFTAMDRLTLGDFCAKVSAKPDSILHDVDQNGEKIIIIEDDSGDVKFLSRAHTEAIVPANAYGRYNVRTNKTGTNVEGFVFPTVINFDQEITPTKLFIGKTTSTIQPDIFGTKVTTSDWMPESSCPAVGQTGTFVLRDENGGVATVPVTIKSIYMDAYESDTNMTIHAVDLSGREFRIKTTGSRMDHLERIVKLSETLKDGRAMSYYLIPSKMEWIPMEGFDDVSSNPYEYSVKTAAEKVAERGGVNLSLVSQGYNEWTVRGLQKYANAVGWDPNRLQSHEAKFLLAACTGLNEEKTAALMKTANTFGRADFNTATLPEIWEEKVASHIPAAEKIASQAAALRHDFFKVASYVENAQTVDALLSLNFVNGENVAKFVSKIPLFKAALSNLCACLIASRLGIREIPEQSAMSAVTKLGDVIRGLEILRSTQNVPTKK